MEKNLKTKMRQRRHNRIRAKISGNAERPRLCVFKSNKQIYAQLIDDSLGKTIAEANSMKITDKKTLTQKAEEVGKKISESAKKAGIDKVVFDKGGFKYSGVIRVLADSARSGGLIF